MTTVKERTRRCGYCGENFVAPRPKSKYCTVLCSIAGVRGVTRARYSAINDDWPDRAACSGMAPMFDDWVPDETPAGRKGRLRAAVLVCQDCPVRVECGQHGNRALEAGIWGGAIQG